MEGKMKVCVLTGKQKLEWVERDIPQPGKGELQIKLEYVGVCGSDLHFYQEGQLANWTLDGPLALGHEPGGVVTAIGEGVEGFAIGDKVSIEPAVPCGECEDCRKGHYNLCKNIKMLAIPGERDGVNAEYCVHSASMCYKLPENMSTMEGALIEPLSVGFYAAEQGDVHVGDTVVILGSGCIGLVTLLACKAHGAGRTIVADLVDARLDKAKELGADYVINSGKSDILEELKKITGGRGGDVVFETAGSPVTIAQTPFAVRRGGRIVLVGMSSQPEINYNFAQIMDKEAEIKSVFRYRNIYPKAIAAVASGAVDVKKVVTHQYDLDHIREAFDEAVNNKTDLVKVVIRIR